MGDDIQLAIEHIRDNDPCRIFIAATGAGAGIQDRLWRVPGISKVLVGCAFPYAPEETDAFLGFTPEKYASAETAVDLAMEAYKRAYKPGGAPAVGVGVTASVTSTHAHRGDHRVFAAYFNDTECRVYSCTLQKSEVHKKVAAGELVDQGEIDHQITLQREIDGKLVDQLGLTTLLRAFQLVTFGDGGLGEVTVDDACALAQERLFAHPYFRADGRREAESDLSKHTVLFPGAFNPPHIGHSGAAEEVRGHGLNVVFSTTVDPPHKDALTTAQILQRAKLMRGQDMLFTRGDPLYVDKAKRFYNRAFIIGVDALIRMFDCKWGTDIPTLLHTFERYNTRFYVAPRLVNGKFMHLDDITIPDPKRDGERMHLHTMREMFTGLAGRWDISSSELRARETKPEITV